MRAKSKKLTKTAIFIVAKICIEINHIDENSKIMDENAIFKMRKNTRKVIQHNHEFEKLYY